MPFFAFDGIISGIERLIAEFERLTVKIRRLTAGIRRLASRIRRLPILCEEKPPHPEVFSQKTKIIVLN
jgi:hypothetical protein